MLNSVDLYPKGKLSNSQLEVRDIALNNFEAFIRLVAPFQSLAHCHIDLCKWIQDREDVNKLVLWPRDHGKSRMAAFYTAWRIVRDPSITIIYASATAEKAEEQLRFVKDLLESKIMFKYFPGLVAQEETKRTSWNKTYIIIDHPMRQQEGVIDATVMTAGLEKNITGKHCRLLIFDDVVVPENNTEEGRKKVNKWVSQAASIMNADGAILAVGTRYHPNDAYQIMMDTNVQMFNENGEIVKDEPAFEVNIANVEEDGDFLWPRTMRKDGKWFGFNQEILAKKRAVYEANGEITQFFAQYYNDPNDKSTAPISRDLFQYYAKKDLSCEFGVWYVDNAALRIYCALDLAASTKNKSDYTAIVVGGIDEKGNRYLLDAIQYKTDQMSVTLEHLVHLYKKYTYRKLRIESVAGFKLAAVDLAEQLKDRGVRVPVDFYHPNQYTASGGEGKAARVNGILEPLYKSRVIYHYKGGFAQMLEDELCMAQPPHDDLKDAWAMCVNLMELPIVRKRRKHSNVVQYHPRFGGVAIAQA